MVIINESNEVIIEYYTPGPEVFEQDISLDGNNKRIIISAPDELNYTNVLAYSLINEILNVGQENKIKLYWNVNNTKVLENFVSYDLDDDVPEKVKKVRAEEIMDLQTHISWELNQEKVGKIYKVLFDRKEGDYFIGRTEFDSPDVDNEVLVKAKDTYVRMGDFANIKIHKADHFDLYGRVSETV